MSTNEDIEEIEANIVAGIEDEQEQGTDRTDARIGPLYLKYEDPPVDVTSEQRTVEQETIDDTIVIQTLGRKADRITVNAIVADWELPYVDALTRYDELSLRTDRWTGDVVITSTSTDFRREKDGRGAWLYDATIECLEINKW